MKKTVSAALIVTIVILSILPILLLAGKIAGNNYNVIPFGIAELVICVITIAASVIALKAKDTELGVGYQILCGLMLPLGLVTIFDLFSSADTIYSMFAIPCVTVCTMIYALKFIKARVVKYVIAVISVMIFAVMCFALMFKG